MNRVNVPKLRFPGFDGEWKSITLGDLLTFKNGLNSDKEKYGKGIKFINVLDILNNDFITYDKIIGSVEVTEKEFEKNEVSYGDILFQRSSETRAEVGQANVYLDRNKSSVFGGFVIRGKAKYEYDPLFMNYLLRTPIARKEITDKSGGSTRYNVGQDTLSKVQLTSTTIPEQQKIASFLSAVDEKIQQLSRKKELLEQYKKGVMQQLFSGKLRFKNENGKEYPDWEEKKLGDVATKKSSNISANKIEDNFGEFIIYGASGILKKVDFYKEESDYISIVKDGAGVGRLLYCKGKSSVLGTMEIISPKQNIDTYFLYCLLSNIDFVKYVTGSTIPHIYFKDYSNEICGIPSIKEQQKIANFLSGIDGKIEKVNGELVKTQEFKKGLLQQMFV
ncbi:restriction endonuclease subunit S [Flavobacterium sp. I-STPA6A]|uniref:restriction endonuclease subunit S n=1 Tax=Flavobacterium sp. I-STPA6A TaxID=2590450 RepID=UPI00131C4644|nr:restriction endonuclease subunit S [Flavobacterium sp. I-STPA6A]